MSEVCLIIIKDSKLVLVKKHYRIIKNIIQNVNLINANAYQEIASQDIDAGYILIDFDNKLLVNQQNAFSLEKAKLFEKFNCLI